MGLLWLHNCSRSYKEDSSSLTTGVIQIESCVDANTLYNNDDVITSKLRGFDIITALLFHDDILTL